MSFKKEIGKKGKIFSIRIIGNFYSGQYYKRGLDSFFVLANSSEEAREIAENNLNVIKEMFQNKRIFNGKRALRLSEKVNFSKNQLGAIKSPNMTSFDKTLTKEGIFKKVSL